MMRNKGTGIVRDTDLTTIIIASVTRLLLRWEGVAIGCCNGDGRATCSTRS